MVNSVDKINVMKYRSCLKMGLVNSVQLIQEHQMMARSVDLINVHWLKSYHQMVHVNFVDFSREQSVVEHYVVLKSVMTDKNS